MADIVKVGRHGEVFLPQKLRAELGMREGDELVVSCKDDTLVLRRRARRFVEYLDRLARAGRD